MKPKKLLQFLQQQMANDDTVLSRKVVKLGKDDTELGKNPKATDEPNDETLDAEVDPNADPDDIDDDGPEMTAIDDVDGDGDTDSLDADVDPESDDADIDAEVDPESDEFPDLNGPMGTKVANGSSDLDSDEPDDASDSGDIDPSDSEGSPGESDDPNKQGTIRTVKGAKLVYKRQEYDGTYTELWMLNNTKDSLRDDLDIRRDVLSGTDIPNNSRTSDDGSQKYDITVLGNVQMLKVTGLPN